MTPFDPQIVAFCCNWCSYAGADLAGVSRLQYPATARIIRIMCTGRLEPQFILKAFELGADGVLIAGCHIGECHYITGNERAKVKVAMSKELLDVLGLTADDCDWNGSPPPEGIKFAKTMDEFTKQLVELGPSPLRGGKK